MGGGNSYVTMGEFIGKAIEFEVESAEYYRDLGQQVDDPRTEKALRKMEEQERKHAATLRNHTVSDADDTRLQFGPSLSLNMPSTPKDRSVDSLLRHAVERERKSARLYEFASDLAGGDFKALLRSLADFERGHEEDLKLLMKRLQV